LYILNTDETDGIRADSSALRLYLQYPSRQLQRKPFFREVKRSFV